MNRDQAEHRAQELAELFNNFDGLKFYLKCVYHIPEGRIRHLVEIAQTKKSPVKYFSVSAKKEME